MSFLTLNGWVVAARSGSVRKSDEEIGNRTRAFSGLYLQSRRALKGAWSVTTKVMTFAAKSALEGFLLGLGDHWPLNVDPFTSDKGLVELGTTVAPFELATAGDGSTIYNAAKFTKAVRPAKGTTNLADDRDLDNKAFVVVLAATQANDVVHYLNGAGSREITYTASGTRSEIYRQVYDPPAASATFTCSLYVRATGSAPTLRFWLEESGASVGSTETVTMRDGEWVRVENITITVSGAGGALLLHVAEDTIDSGAVFALDGVQVEAKEYSTTWLDSPSARADANLEFNATVLALDQGGYTINAWTRGPNLEQTSGAGNALALVGDTSSEYLAIFNDPATNEIQLDTAGTGAVVSPLKYSGSPWDGAWHLVTCVVRASPPAAHAEREIYFDGVLVASDNPGAGAYPSHSVVAAGRIYIGEGSPFGAFDFNGPIEDLSIMPYPAAAEQITAWAAATQALPVAPSMRAEGDFDQRAEVTCVAEVGTQPYTEAAIDGTFHSNSSAIDFQLLER